MVFIDRQLALSALWTTLYFPYTFAAPLFEALLDLEQGDGRKFYTFVGNLTVTCEGCHPLTVDDAGASPDADISVQCADSGPISDDLTFLKGTYDALSAQTYMVEMIFSYAIRCVYVVPTFWPEPTFLHLHPRAVDGLWRARVVSTGLLVAIQASHSYLSETLMVLHYFMEEFPPTNCSLVDPVTPLQK